MDGWMDGEDLIICVARLVVQKLCPPLVCDEVRVVCIASRNRLRSTSLFEAIFEVFGGQNGGQNSIFGLFFFDVIFECVFTSILA